MIANTPQIDDGLDRQHTVPPVEQTDRSQSKYEKYLSQKEFKQFYFLYRQRAGGNKVRLRVDSSVKIPITNVVSARGFSSRLGRDDGSGDKEYKKNGVKYVVGRSINVIIDYTERDTLLPSVEGIDAYVQPNGVVVFAVENSNHRTAAAIARGTEELSIDGYISIHMLRENIYDPASTETK